MLQLRLIHQVLIYLHTKPVLKYPNMEIIIQMKVPVKEKRRITIIVSGFLIAQILCSC